MQHYHHHTGARTGMAFGRLLYILPVFAALLVSAMAPHAVYAEIFANEDFSIEYPDGWHVASPDAWESGKSVSFSASSTAGPASSITISLHDGYVRAGTTKAMQMEQADLDVAEAIATDASKRCRQNLDGVCWGFELLDSRITSVSYQRAVLVEFGSYVDDAEMLTRLVVLPTDSGVWMARGMAVAGQDDDDLRRQVWDALATFELAAGGTVPEPAALQDPLPSGPSDPDLILEKTLKINMIMVGQKWSQPDVARILEELPSYHDPVFTTTGDRVGVRYHYDYSFASDVQNTDELLRVMEDNSRNHPVLGDRVDDYAPFWHAAWLEGHPSLRDKQYRLVDASAVEEYVHDVIIGTNTDLSRHGGPSVVNLVFLNIRPDKTDHIQNYYVPTADRATGREMNHVGMMGYGSSVSDSNMFFFDMWALPWVDPELEDLYRTPAYMGNLHDCREPSCTADIATRHAVSSIYHILTPSFLYPVEFYDNYFLDVLLYLTPGGKVTVTPSVLDHFMNRDEIIREMEYLYPYAGWDVKMSVERRDLRGLSYEFKTQFDRTRHEQVEIFDRIVKFAYHDPDRLTPYLIEWAQERQQDERPSTSNNTWTIPMLIVVDNTNAEVLLEGGAIGIAPGMPDDESLPCCALAVTDASDVWENEIALDNLILHELGHVMGLHHPFVSFEYGEPTYDFYFNWYSSPMAYSSPDGWSACGFLYNLFYEHPCGNAAASFTAFERERLGDARLVSLLKTIEAEAGSLPGDAAGEVATDMAEIRRVFAAGDTLSDAGALQAALALYDEVGSLAVENPSEAQPDTGAVLQPNGAAPAEPDAAEPGDAPAEGAGQKEALPGNGDTDDGNPDGAGIAQAGEPGDLPTWVKSSAGWWADGLITDSEFISSIEYLIESGVIVVDAGGHIPAGDAGGRAIPEWVKSSAGWWADGLLGDDEFAGSIQYLISVGIIRV